MKCSTQTRIEVTLLRWLSRKCLFPLLSDGELWPHQELPGPGGDIHYTDDDTVSHRGEESHHRTVQLRPRDDTWSQVTERHKQTDAIKKFSEPTMCLMVSIVTMVLRVCVLVTGSTPGWARWSWITRTPWRRWWRSLFRMERCENCYTIQWCIDFCALSRCHWLFLRLFKGIQCVKFRAYIKMLYVMFSRLEICFNWLEFSTLSRVSSKQSLM